MSVGCFGGLLRIIITKRGRGGGGRSIFYLRLLLQGREKKDGNKRESQSRRHSKKKVMVKIQGPKKMLNVYRVDAQIWPADWNVSQWISGAASAQTQPDSCHGKFVSFDLMKRRVCFVYARRVLNPRQKAASPMKLL